MHQTKHQTESIGPSDWASHSHPSAQDLIRGSFVPLRVKVVFFATCVGGSMWLSPLCRY